MSITEHHDTLLNKTFKLPYFNSEVTSDDLLITYSSVINGAILEALRHLAAHPDWDAVPCFITEVYDEEGIDETADYIFDIKRETFEDQLHLCLDYYVKNEDYEIASELSSLREKLK